jgi:hypothetical protein
LRLFKAFLMIKDPVIRRAVIRAGRKKIEAADVR